MMSVCYLLYQFDRNCVFLIFIFLVDVAFRSHYFSPQVTALALAVALFRFNLYKTVKTGYNPGITARRAFSRSIVHILNRDNSENLERDEVEPRFTASSPKAACVGSTPSPFPSSLESALLISYPPERLQFKGTELLRD